MKGYLTPQHIARLCGKEHRKRNDYILKCPAHKDALPSLKVSKGHKATLLYCHTGCTLNEICEALNIKPEMLFYNYQKSGNNSGEALSMLNDMIRRRIPPNRWELERHESFQDVVYEVMDVSPEVWATVQVRWLDELERPFMDVWKQWYTMEAILMDLLVEHLDEGWDYNIERRNDLRWKLLNEWEAGRENGTRQWRKEHG